MAGVSSSGKMGSLESFCNIGCGEKTSGLPLSGVLQSPCFVPLNSSGLGSPPTNFQTNKANFPSSSDTHSCQLAVVKMKKHSRSSHRESMNNTQSLASGHSSRNSKESDSRIVSLSRTLSRLGQSMRRRSTAPGQPVLPTNFASLLGNDASWLKSLDTHFESQQSPVVKLKVILKVSEFSSSASSLMKINEPRKLTSLQDPSGASSHGRIYAFNHIYVPGDPVKDINVNSLGGILKAVLGGSDGCVFTFGLAKTGKTYTMLGVDSSVDNFGVIPFAIAWLFHLIRHRQERRETEISVYMSAVEVFDSGEVLQDLLAHVGDSSDISNQPVDVNDLPVNGTYLRNQREVKICSPQDAGHLLDAAIASHSAPGGRNRVAQNVHVVFSFRLWQRQINGQSSSKQGFSSCLRLIDFSSARRDKGGSAITFSGLTSIIQAVLSGKRDLPFRDKNITKIILESLGGPSCHICMITHVSLTRHTFRDLQYVIHVSSQLQEQHTNKRSKTLGMASSLCGGLNASLPNIPQRRPRAIQMGTRLYHHALQKSTTYSDPEGILPEKLPSYYGRFQSGAVSSWQIDSAVRSSLGAWKTPERVLPVKTNCQSVESIRCFSDIGYRRSDSSAAYKAAPLAYCIIPEAAALSSPLSYQNPAKRSNMPVSVAHHMAGPVTNASSLHCSNACCSVEASAKRHTGEVWVDGPQEFQVNRGPEFCQQVQLGSQSEDAEAQSTQKRLSFPVTKLSSSPRRSVDRKADGTVSDSFTTRKSCSKLFSSRNNSVKAKPSALRKERVDSSCVDCSVRRNCEIEEEKKKAVAVFNSTNHDKFLSFKEASDATASVSQFLITECMKDPATLVKESDLIGPDHSSVSCVNIVSVHDSEKLAKEIVHSRHKEALISDRESVYEVMFEETLEDGNLCRSPNLNSKQLSEEDDNFKHDPAVVESKTADLSQELVTSFVKQWPSRKTKQVSCYSPGSTTSPKTHDRHGCRPGIVTSSSRKSFPYLGSQAIHAEFLSYKPQAGPSVANKSMSCEAGIQSPYSAVTQARPPTSASSGLGSEVSSTVSSDAQMPTSCRSEVEYSSGYDEIVMRDNDSLVTTSQQMSGKKSSSSTDILMQKKCVTVRSNVRSASNTGFVPSSSTQSNSSRVCISPEVLNHRTPAVMKGCLPTSTEAQQLVEPNASQRSGLQVLGISSYRRELDFTPTSVLRVANTRNKASSYTTINNSYTCAVDATQCFRVEDLKEPKRRNSSKSRMPKINCFN